MILNPSPQQGNGGDVYSNTPVLQHSNTPVCSMDSEYAKETRFFPLLCPIICYEAVSYEDEPVRAVHNHLIMG